MEINIKLDIKQNKKKGHPIVLSIYVSKSDRLYRYTGFYATPEIWDFSKEEPKKTHPHYVGVMDFLFEKRRIINQIINSRKKLTAEQICNKILKNSESLYDFWEDRIKEIENKGTATAYKNTLNEFRRYRENVLFEDIDYNFLNGFKLWKKKTCSNNGINTYLKNIKAVYNEAIRRNIYAPESFISPFNKIMERPEATKDKYLTMSEMKIIIKNKEKTKYDYYFLLCFLLGGIDFIDLANLKKSHIIGDRIKFARFKGGTNEIIDNFIFPEAREIINITEKGEYITDIFTHSNINTIRGNYTERYRKILNKIGVTSYFSSKSARYTFINIGKELLINREVIMELTGHARNDVHSIYEGKFSNNIKDEAHKQIIDAVLSD